VCSPRDQGFSRGSRDLAPESPRRSKESGTKRGVSERGLRMKLIDSRTREVKSRWISSCPSWIHSSSSFRHPESSVTCSRHRQATGMIYSETGSGRGRMRAHRAPTVGDRCSPDDQGRHRGPDRATDAQGGTATMRAPAHAVRTSHWMADWVGVWALGIGRIC
jgi:hypothetical protein